MTESLPPWLQRQLRLLRPVPGHALLLAGPSGLGQLELARALAQTWLCDAPSEDGACGICASCRRLAVHTHADFRALVPETLAQALDWPLEEKVRRELDERRRKPSHDIRIEALRELLVFAQRSAAGERGRVALIFPADRMNTVSANALLKTLEEPPGDLRFILATEAVHELPATVISRCQRHAMAWPAPDEALSWLTGQGVGAAEAGALLRWTGDRPFAALALARQGLSDPARILLEAVQRGDAAAVADWHAALLYDGLLKLCHDCMRLRSGAMPRYWPEDRLPSPPPWVTLERWSRELLDGVRAADHPLHAGLLADALVVRAHQHLNSLV